ncbi:phosphatase, partial [Klebsiella pneumoniae]|nr:phosphatase [Klebsiella pneumoniae]
LLAQVTPANYRARIERLFLFHLQAFDWNCPQHITPRYSAQQVAEYSQNLQQRIHDLEQENQRLQQQLARRGE